MNEDFKIISFGLLIIVIAGLLLLGTTYSFGLFYIFLVGLENQSFGEIVLYGASIYSITIIGLMVILNLDIMNKEKMVESNG